MAGKSKLSVAMKIAKCVDKLFDNLVEEKLLDKDNDIVGNIKAAKDSFKKTVASFNESQTPKKTKKSKTRKSKSKKKEKAPEQSVAPGV